MCGRLHNPLPPHVGLHAFLDPTGNSPGPGDDCRIVDPDAQERGSFDPQLWRIAPNASTRIERVVGAAHHGSRTSALTSAHGPSATSGDVRFVISGSGPQPIPCIQRGDLVCLSQRRIVEGVFYEIVERAFQVQHRPWISSVAPSPTMCTPSSRRVLMENSIFIMPAFSPMMWPREVSRNRAMPHS